MTWHHQVVTKQLTNETKHNYNYIVLRCYNIDERCGGVSDRLKPIPLLLLAAARSKRILFIHWYKRPCALEEFLQPPPNGGLNWTVPSFLQDDFLRQRRGALTRASMLLKGATTDGWIKPVHIHDAQGGSAQYDEEYGPSAFLNVFHDVFRILFQPSPNLQAVIEEKMAHNNNNDVHMEPGKYSVAHYRAEYGREVSRHPKLTEPSFIRNIAINSLRCAIEIQPGDPIYFASDNMIALQAVQKIAAFTKYPILTFDRDETIVLRLDDTGINHTDAGDDDPPVKYQPKDYYSTFVDLYLAGNGDCTVFGRGGFGRFANLLSFNASCAFKHVKQFYAVNCKGLPPLDKDENQLARAGLKLADDKIQ
ncbi:MAG: hypothetical protein SGILL_010268 [Bacillariaceae sp.]